ncbi:MAG: GntR family transcriptional regulator [Sarcina sp.]
MILELDFESEVPIYLQLKNEIIKAVARGNLLENDSLPSVRNFAADLDINMHTVNKTYTTLKDEGYVKMDRRKGALISYDFKEKNEAFKNNLFKELEIYVAESVARGIDKSVVIDSLKNIFSDYERK